MAQKSQKKKYKLFGSAPYSGWSSPTKMSCSLTELNCCTTINIIINVKFASTYYNKDMGATWNTVNG